jgi:SOS-response transcriptional repressor LexA
VSFSLTHKQQTVFDYIVRFIGEHRKSPLIREIQLGCQIASYKSALDRLNALERKGFIRRTPNKHRGIRIVKRVLGTLEAARPPEATLEAAGAAGEGAAG